MKKILKNYQNQPPTEFINFLRIMIAIHVSKDEVLMVNPIHFGFRILGLNKFLMYDTL